jgi:hypothetical protein
MVQGDGVEEQGDEHAATHHAASFTVVALT